MIELFPNVYDMWKRVIELQVENALKQATPTKIMEYLSHFRESLPSDDERDFLDFYFKLRMEQLYEDNNNQR